MQGPRRIYSRVNQRAKESAIRRDHLFPGYVIRGCLGSYVLLKGFYIIDRSPPIVAIDGPLENRHTLYFGELKEEQAAVRARASSKFPEWFEASNKHAG